MAAGPPDLITKAVYGSGLFDRQDDAWKSELVGALYRRPVSGETLIMHGDRDPQFFVVESGRFVAGDVVFGPGQSYGYMHILSKSALAHPHDVYGEGVLWWLDRPRFRNALRVRSEAAKLAEEELRSKTTAVNKSPTSNIRTRSEERKGTLHVESNVLARTRSAEENKNLLGESGVVLRHRSDEKDDFSKRKHLNQDNSKQNCSDNDSNEFAPRGSLFIYEESISSRRLSVDSERSSGSSIASLTVARELAGGHRRRSAPQEPDPLSGGTELFVAPKRGAASRSTSPNWWDGPLPTPPSRANSTVAPAPYIPAVPTTPSSARNKQTGNWWDNPGADPRGSLSKPSTPNQVPRTAPTTTSSTPAVASSDRSFLSSSYKSDGASRNTPSSAPNPSPKKFFPDGGTASAAPIDKFSLGSSSISSALPAFSRSLPSSASSSPNISPTTPNLPARAYSVSTSHNVSTPSPKRATSVILPPLSPAALAAEALDRSTISPPVSPSYPSPTKQGGRSASSPKSTTRTTSPSSKTATVNSSVNGSTANKPDNSPTSSTRDRGKTGLGLSPAATAALDKALALASAPSPRSASQPGSPDLSKAPRTKRAHSARATSTEKLPGHSRSHTLMMATPLHWKKRENIDVTNIMYNKVRRAEKPAPEYGLAGNLACMVEEFSNDGSRALSTTTPPIHTRTVSLLKSPTKKPKEATTAVTAEQKGLDLLTLPDLVVVGTLGRGAYAHVQLVTETVSKAGVTTVHALKTVNKMLLYEQQQVAHLLSEKDVLRSLHHPFIIKLRRTFKDLHYLHFLMEPCLGGELGTLLTEMRFFEKPVALHVAACVVLALEHMHAQGIVYRDLKPDNVLLQPNGYIKLVDFGFAKRINTDKTHTMCGTPAYLAPEVIAGEGYDINCDWWTLGILLYEMMVGETPFQSDNPMATYQLIIANNPQFPDDLPKEDREFILRFLRPTGLRPSSAKEVKSDPWFEGTDWSRLLRLEAVVPPEMMVEVSGETDLSKFDDAFGEDERWSDWIPLDPDPFDAF